MCRRTTTGVGSWRWEGGVLSFSQEGGADRAWEGTGKLLIWAYGVLSRTGTRKRWNERALSDRRRKRSTKILHTALYCLVGNHAVIRLNTEIVKRLK